MTDKQGLSSQTVSFVSKSAFAELGLEETITLAKAQIQALYLADYLPWVVGYSGGKDSTATLQLVWEAISELPSEQRKKTIHVISTDTLVENPVVAMWVDNSLKVMMQAANKQGMPIVAHRLTPAIENSFWVNLIGRGYPAPRKMFRWCTSRLKIDPSNTFISEMLNQHGEAIVVLGTRSAESNSRKKTMEVYAKGSTRADFDLSRNGNPKLDRCWIYSPVKHWSNDDVWEYLAVHQNPWGVPNSDLLSMYRDGTKDRECPLVVDSTTPSCGDSRFGCFVCTLVEKDKSMSAMIQNDEEKKWMQPLSDFRNIWLDISLEKEEGGFSGRNREWKNRDFRRMNGSLMLMAKGEDLSDAKLVHGPYKQEYRAGLLRAILEAELDCRKMAPESLNDFRVINDDELRAIRRIWLEEKYEIEDVLPKIYQEVTGKEYFDLTERDSLKFDAEALALLKQVAQDATDESAHEGGQVASEQADLLYEGLRNLLFIEQNYQRATRRSGVLQELEQVLKRSAWTGEEEALEFALQRETLRRSKGQELALAELEVATGDESVVFTDEVVELKTAQVENSEGMRK